MNFEGNALNLGETVLLEEEIQAFSEVLIQNGIIISALHNHWLFTEPNILLFTSYPLNHI
ncbi:DUF1259 domain-containing protein [Oceanobacillus limi]|uniref:DUF1259 domain-containing protein n=1 Tax=Oceanobacillus limi TaxID=930131 RepID=UPI000A8783E7|nr:DUF1259 domain-containing protein [Oceanobacillus limi]